MSSPAFHVPALDLKGIYTPETCPDSALLERLANEIFRGANGSDSEHLQALENLPERRLPDGSERVLGSSGGGGGSNLSGGFPSPSPITPPVHPVVEPAQPTERRLNAKGELQEKLPTGGHEPDSKGVYPFGEPRHSERGKRLAQMSGVFPREYSAGPEFYFLPSDVQKAGSEPGVALFNPEGVRRDFPALHQRVNGQPLIYLDNAATTHKPQAVLDATGQFYGRDNANIHRAAHELSERATRHFEEGREKVRQFLGAADKKEIVFVRGTTEAINLVAQTYGRKNIGQGDEILLSEMEHHANIVPWQLLAEQVGAMIRVIPINDRGELILEDYARLLGPKTKLVSVAHVSNSLGTINPIEEIIPLAHARGIPVLVDGAQATPHLPVNVTALDADFYAFSGHKVFGPTGIGALYAKRHLLEAMPPYQGGGHMIEDVRFERTLYRSAPEKFEAGTPDIAGVIGLGAAIDYLFSIGIPRIAAYEHELLEYATAALETVPGLKQIGTARQKASVLSFVFPGVPNSKVADYLDQKGIAVRAGHHCAMPAQRRFGLESTVRPSLAFYNTHQEIDVLVRALREFPR